MITNLAARISGYWRDPYAARPEPLQPLPTLRDRIERARAQVRDLTVAADMNWSR